MNTNFKILLFVFALITSSMNAQDKINLMVSQESLVKISSLTATGNIDQLKIELNEGLNNGLTVNEIKEALVQLYAYCGFPRSLNAINEFKAVLDERKSNGIADVEGKEISVENNPPDKYEQGRKVLEILTKTPQTKPAKGFGEFAPRIDAFLKEHLFADIFASDVLTYQQRELITISALASIEGLESQLKAHIGIGKNTGITDHQLIQSAELIARTVNLSQAEIFRKIINENSLK
ncbi:carboxymuconolactone decarboxylase family protein [Chryseobacterium sp. C39-AII1]|uniref:carboxymuconolactone decarboxylase family protein n=1 Tax=Chryseobacterium sp. C39-AII1 TaxID=3080332 RepID=UPI003209F49D